MDHKHDAPSESQIKQMIIYETHKEKISSQPTVSILKIFEDQTIQLSKDGMSAKDVAEVMPQYEGKRSSLH